MWDRESAASRWAYYRDFGDTRLLVLDSRAARVLADGQREMVDEEEWDWIVDHSVGAFDHVIIASTLPVFMPRGIHHLQAWNEALCAGRLGKKVADLSERSGARSISSIGRHSTARSSASATGCARSQRASETALHRHRSSCSAVTCTAPTCPRST